MHSETKAGLLWKCPHDAAFHFGLAHDCEAQKGEDGCDRWVLSGCKYPKPHLCIPADEAREFLNLLVRALVYVNEPILSQDMITRKVRALLALLPKEAAENEGEV